MYSDLGGNAQSFTYTFDPQNRLKKWQNGAGLACAFGLDRYGNLGDASGNPSCGMLTGRSFNRSLWSMRRAGLAGRLWSG